jgi:hypothetical protein
MDSKKEKLIGIVGEKNIFDAPETLEAYSRDQSFVRPMNPWLVVWPKNVDEVQAIVKWANETNTPLVPVSSDPPHFHGDTAPQGGPGAPGDLIGGWLGLSVDFSACPAGVSVDNASLSRFGSAWWPVTQTSPVAQPHPIPGVGSAFIPPVPVGIPTETHFSLSFIPVNTFQVGARCAVTIVLRYVQ